MKLESLVELHNSLALLNPNEPIAVTCNFGKLCYRQLGKLVLVSGVEGLFFPTPDIDLGILTPSDFHDLMTNLERLIQDPALVDSRLETHIEHYGFKVYRVYKDPNLVGPQLYLEIKFVTFKNKLISRFILNHFNPDTKVLLKSMINEKRRCKSSKQK